MLLLFDFKQRKHFSKDMFGILVQKKEEGQMPHFSSYCYLLAILFFTTQHKAPRRSLLSWKPVKETSVFKLCDWGSSQLEEQLKDVEAMRFTVYDFFTFVALQFKFLNLKNLQLLLLHICMWIQHTILMNFFGMHLFFHIFNF